MGELAEGVQDVQTRVGHRNEGQGQGHCSPQRGLTITQLMEREREREEGCKFIFLKQRINGNRCVNETRMVQMRKRRLKPQTRLQKFEKKLTRCPNVRRAISEPISSPMAMRAIPRTATPWEEN